MKIGIMGSGGVGGYYGACLARAGHDVAFIARGAHLQALQRSGLQVRSVHGNFIVAPVRAMEEPSEVGLVDLVLVCVKTPQTEQAAHAIQAMVGPDTAVLSLQNGIDAAERLGAVIGLDHMLGGVTWISSAIEAPGVIRQVSSFRRIVVGELDRRVTPRARAVVAALRDSGAGVELTDEIQKVLWTKFVFIAALSGVGALTRLAVGEYRAIPETRTLLVSLMREVEAVARASGIALEADVVEEALAIVDSAAPHIRASMQRDVETGRPSEVESMIGVIGRKGRELGVLTPTADTVYAALLPGERLARMTWNP